MRMRRIGLFGGLFFAFFLAGLGCSTGPPMGTVTGTITVDEEPAEMGAITFIPADGKSPTTGGAIKEGKYSVQVYVGKSRVEIRVPKVVGQVKIYDTPDSPIQDDMRETLPAKYNDKTELTIDVKRGLNEKDWNLETK